MVWQAHGMVCASWLQIENVALLTDEDEFVPEGMFLSPRHIVENGKCWMLFY